MKKDTYERTEQFERIDFVSSPAAARERKIEKNRTRASSSDPKKKPERT
jgi:hypothetical protein